MFHPRSIVMLGLMLLASATSFAAPPSIDASASKGESKTTQQVNPSQPQPSADIEVIEVVETIVVDASGKDVTVKAKNATATPTNTPAGDDNNDAIEDVTAVTTDDGKDGAPSSSWKDILGRLHPPLVHLPIGWLTLALIIECMVFIVGYTYLQPAGLLILWGTALSYVPGIISGLLRFQSYDNDPEVIAEVIEHRNVMFISFGFVVTALIYRIVRKRHMQGNERYAYLALLALADVIMGLGGHMGGELVFGDDYLPF